MELLSDMKHLRRINRFMIAAESAFDKDDSLRNCNLGIWLPRKAIYLMFHPDGDVLAATPEVVHHGLKERYVKRCNIAAYPTHSERFSEFIDDFQVEGHTRETPVGWFFTSRERIPLILECEGRQKMLNGIAGIGWLLYRAIPTTSYESGRETRQVETRGMLTWHV